MFDRHRNEGTLIFWKKQKGGMVVTKRNRKRFTMLFQDEHLTLTLFC